MLTFRYLKGIQAPMFVCDVCDEPIRKAAEGMVKYGWNGDDKNAVLLFCHKGECDRKSHDGEFLYWHELDTFLAWLDQNTKFNRAEVGFKADTLAAF